MLSEFVIGAFVGVDKFVGVTRPLHPWCRYWCCGRFAQGLVVLAALEFQRQAIGGESDVEAVLGGFVGAGAESRVRSLRGASR